MLVQCIVSTCQLSTSNSDDARSEDSIRITVRIDYTTVVLVPGTLEYSEYPCKVRVQPIQFVFKTTLKRTQYLSVEFRQIIYRPQIYRIISTKVCVREKYIAQVQYSTVLVFSNLEVVIAGIAFYIVNIVITVTFYNRFYNSLIHQYLFL